MPLGTNVVTHVADFNTKTGVFLLNQNGAGVINIRLLDTSAAATTFTVFSGPIPDAAVDISDFETPRGYLPLDPADWDAGELIHAQAFMALYGFAMAKGGPTTDDELRLTPNRAPLYGTGGGDNVQMSVSIHGGTFITK